MSKKEKQAERLAVLEADLRSRLMRDLDSVAEGKNTLFFVTAEFNPHDLSEHVLSRGTAEGPCDDVVQERFQLRPSLSSRQRIAPVNQLAPDRRCDRTLLFT
jgi:hypothetical protein